MLILFVILPTLFCVFILFGYHVIPIGSSERISFSLDMLLAVILFILGILFFAIFFYINYYSLIYYLKKKSINGKNSSFWSVNESWKNILFSSNDLFFNNVIMWWIMLTNLLYNNMKQKLKKMKK